jgi:hypothetical protein
MLPVRIFPLPHWLWALLAASLGLLLLLELIEPAVAQSSDVASPGTAPLRLTEAQSSAQEPLADLPDGHHQLCSEPDPEDWRDGAGVCLDFSKQDRYIQGYYGYPHSSDFVCLQGELDSLGIVQGEGHLLIWGETTADAIPSGRFAWDSEGHLNLDDAGPLRQVGEGHFPLYLVLFREAELNTDRFYHYPLPRMKSHLDLCDWPVEQSITAPIVVPSTP